MKCLKLPGTGVPSVVRLPDNRLVQIDCKNVFVKNSPGKVVCTIGIEDVIIVETDDALLVCSKGNSHRVGEVVDTLRREGLEEYL